MKTQKNYYLWEISMFHLCVRLARELKEQGIKEYKDRLRMARNWWICAMKSKQTFKTTY